MTQQLLPPYPENVPLLKGALVSIPSSGPRVTLEFQYNPDALRRTLTPNTVGGEEGDRSEEVRFTGAPRETISLPVRLEADAGTTNGVYPELAALELLAYPSLDQVQTIDSKLEGGAIEIVPPTAPRLLFVWGPQRVVPVRLTSYRIDEQLFDARLNPITAVVTLELRVITYSDVFSDNPDYGLSVSHQQTLQTLAGTAPAADDQELGVDVSDL